MTPEDLIRFSGRFGTLDDCRVVPQTRLAGYREVLAVHHQPGTKTTLGNGKDWHSDFHYTARPAVGSILLCQQPASIGGDTMFANLYTGYDTLSAGMKQLVDPLLAVHDITLGSVDAASAAKLTGRTLRYRSPARSARIRKHSARRSS